MMRSVLVLVAASGLQFVHAADVAKGKTIFDQRCGICHATTTAPGGPVAGPSLVGVVGRKAASVSGFPMYSDALKKASLTWSPKVLDEFLTMPMARVPGTTMPMMLGDAKERGDVVAYLATLKPAK